MEQRNGQYMAANKWGEVADEQVQVLTVDCFYYCFIWSGFYVTSSVLVVSNLQVNQNILYPFRRVRQGEAKSIGKYKKKFRKIANKN